MPVNSVNRAFFNVKSSSALPVLQSLLILLTLSASASIFAYTFEVFTDKTQKFKVFQQHGGLWMATNGGAIRWDMAANRATEYTTQQGLSDNYLTRAVADFAGNVWFSSRAGLEMFDGQTWHTHTDLPRWSNNDWVLLSNDGGRILYSFCDYEKTAFACFEGSNRLSNDAVSGAFVWRDGKNRRWEWLRQSALQPFPPTLAFSYFKIASGADTVTDTLSKMYLYLPENCHVDQNGRLWVPYVSAISSSSAPTGYSMFDGVAWRHIGDTSGAFSSVILNINKTGFPIDTGAGRYRYRFLRINGKTDTVDCSKWAEFSRKKDSLCIPPSMTIDTAGRLWIGTVSGLVCYDESGAREFNFQTGPLGTYPTSLVEDAKGNVWVLGDGLSIFDGRTWSYPQKTNLGIASFQIAKVVPSSADSGGMWLMSGTYYDEEAKLVGNGIAYYNGRSWGETKFYTQNEGLASDVVLDMAVDADKALWCVCGGDSTHLCMFKNNTWTTIALPDSLKGAVRQLFIDRKGGIWLLANNSARFDGTQWKVFSAVLYEGYAGCNSVFEDSKGVVWFATHSLGLYRYDGTSWSKVIVDAASPASFVSSIGEDATGALWVGLGCDWTGSGYVNCKGLWRQDATGWKKFSTENGLGFDLVSTMLCDKSGAMWFACYPGVGQGVTSVSRFDGTNWKTFSTKDGLSDPRVRAMHAATNGDIWFTTYTGITRLKSDGSATRFSPSSKPTRSTRVSILKILAMTPQRAGKIGSAELYDILGRRVTEQPCDRKSIIKGVYIAVNKKTESGYSR